MIISIATLALALLLLISSLISFTPLVVYLAILLLALSLVTDGVALYLLFRQQAGLIQIVRGILLFVFFFMLLLHFVLK